MSRRITKTVDTNRKICDKCGTTEKVHSYQFTPDDIRDLCDFCFFSVQAKKVYNE